MVEYRSAKIIAFVGSGGKTSSIYSYAGTLSSKGKKVVISTTTHMQFPDKKYLPLCTNEAQVLKKLSTETDELCGSIAVLAEDAGVLSGVHKMRTPDLRELEKCCRTCDFLLVEADGAKCLPLKAPAAHEPVIPVGCDVVVVCAGLDSLNKKLGEVCFRQDEVIEILSNRLGTSISPSHVISKNDVAWILFDGYIQPLYENHKTKEVCVLLNKSDMLLSLEEAKNIASYLNGLSARIQNEHPTVAWGGVHIASIKNGSSTFCPPC